MNFIHAAPFQKQSLQSSLTIEQKQETQKEDNMTSHHRNQEHKWTKSSERN